MQMSVKKQNAIEKGRIKLSADLFFEICKTGLKIDPASFFANDVLKSKKQGA